LWRNNRLPEEVWGHPAEAVVRLHDKHERDTRVPNNDVCFNIPFRVIDKLATMYAGRISERTLELAEIDALFKDRKSSTSALAAKLRQRLQTTKYTSDRRNNSAGSAFAIMNTSNNLTYLRTSTIAESSLSSAVQCNWLTASETARHLKVKPRALLQWVRDGKVPAHKLSGIQRCVRRFLKPELGAMLFPSSADSADGGQL